MEVKLVSTLIAELSDEQLVKIKNLCNYEYIIERGAEILRNMIQNFDFDVESLNFGTRTTLIVTDLEGKESVNFDTSHSETIVGLSKMCELNLMYNKIEMKTTL